MWTIPAVIQLRSRRIIMDGRTRPWSRVLLAQFSSLPFIACGVLILLGVNGALYWIVPGVVVSLIATVLNAWVLLVEILR